LTVLSGSYFPAPYACRIRSRPSSMRDTVERGATQLPHRRSQRRRRRREDSG
jgi:hypothetical protein